MNFNADIILSPEKKEDFLANQVNNTQRFIIMLIDMFLGNEH